MKKIKLLTTFVLLLSCLQSGDAQTWVDSLDAYAREVYLPAAKYRWSWQNASLLSVMVKQYDKSAPSEQKIYFDYVKQAMDKTYGKANGKSPNAVASGLGMAFLYRVTGDEKYKLKCDKIFNEYLQTRRTAEGAVSHLSFTLQLWDDTVFMIGEFLLGMYRATGDEKYLDELATQIKLHRDKLLDEEWGLWYHGWDSDAKSRCTFCGQWNWPDKTTGKSPELWGRGNGWVIVSLSDALREIPKDNIHWNEFAGYLKEMVQRLPELQDKKTGHWYQLPVRNNDPENYIESSCTAMFAYGINSALDLGIVTGNDFNTSADLAYQGLRKYSMRQSGNYVTTMNVCKGTCIGNKNYYFNRKTKREKPSGIAMFLNFGLSYKP
ncbi:MAG: glycoside hydrolase family 88 protein [Chitinophagales bacterium]|nr:glycoside hydrolase family 88 protein [Chitinophagales bacterium]